MSARDLSTNTVEQAARFERDHADAPPWTPPFILHEHNPEAGTHGAGTRPDICEACVSYARTYAAAPPAPHVCGPGGHGDCERVAANLTWRDQMNREEGP